MPYLLPIVVGLLLAMGVVVSVAQARLSQLVTDSDQIVLWGGLLLSALSLGILVLYLLWQP
jgi:hypothetical protein